MKIKDFFENYRNIYEIDVNLYGKDNRLEDGRNIYTTDELKEFIEKHGDKEVKEWSVENGGYSTKISFILK